MDRRDWAFWISISFMLLIALGFFFNVFVVNIPRDTLSLGNIFGSSSSGNFSSCYNLNFADTNYCVNSFVRNHFIYNVTSDSVSLSDRELFSRGGDCKDWSEFYVRELSKYGVSADVVNFAVNGSRGHEIAISHGDSIYCILDQRSVECRVVG